MRGLFTAGVIDGMMEAGIVFDGAIGVSAGAVFGCNYKSNQPGRVLRYNLRFCKDPRYSSFRSLVHTGQPVYHNCLEGGEEDLDWFRASASMPLAARIVSVGGYDLLDGGIADSIPLAYLEGQGYDRNVVILTQPMGYVKTKNKALPLMRRVYRDYPALLDTLARRQDVYNETTAAIREKERRGEVFVIRPEAPLDIKRVDHNRARIQAVYDLGRAVAEKRLAAMRTFLEERGNQP